MILMGARLWDDLGLDGIELQINSLGQPEERAQHRAALIAYFEEHAEILDEDAKRRLHQSAAHPRYQESRSAGHVRCRAEADRLPRRGVPATSKACSACCAMPAFPTRSTRVWCAVSITTT
jgi:histidyl-tRNA synthetase